MRAAAVPLAPGAVAPFRVLAFRAADGIALRGALWRPEQGASRGLVLLLPGRTEYIEKTAITAAGFVARGYAAAALDWRGQGLSERALENSLKGHVEDFSHYLDDLVALAAVPEVAAEGPPRLLFGHSMGGLIALMAHRAGTTPKVPMILSAPMLGFAFGSVQIAFAQVTMSLARALDRLDRFPPLPNAGVPYPLHAAFEGNLLTSDREIWDWTVATLKAEPRLRLALPTIGWFDAAYAAMDEAAAFDPLNVPTLAFVGSDERVVSADAVREGAARLGARFALIEGARHEPLNDAAEIRDRTWTEIDAFLTELPGSSGPTHPRNV